MNLIDSQFISFCIVTVLLTVTPGVDTFVVIRNVLRGGKKDGIITSFGICFGLFFHATLSACGLSIILVQSAFMFHSVKMLGAIYLCYLGLSSLLNALNRKESFEVNSNISNAGNGVATNSFREGFLSNILVTFKSCGIMIFEPLRSGY